jgi:hypothetical protein
MLLDSCATSKSLVSTAELPETMPNGRHGNGTYPHMPLPGQRRVRQPANKMMLLIQKLKERKQYRMKII